MPNSKATAIRLRPDEVAAIDAALIAHRKRTGESTRLADAIRRGLEFFCAGEGVAWPAKDVAPGKDAASARSCAGCKHNTGESRWTCPPVAGVWVATHCAGHIGPEDPNWPPTAPACPGRENA